MPRASSSEVTGRFGAATAKQVLEIACREVGLDTMGAVAMRLGENALFHLPDEGVVVRIARAMEYWPDAVKEVSVSRWLTQHGIPAAQTYPVSQPVSAVGHPVTFWRFIDGRAGERGDIAELGHMLRRLHALPRPTDFDLPGEDVLDRVRPRIAAAAIGEDDRGFLLRRLEELSDAVAGLDFARAPAVTHGDAHIGNLMFPGGVTTLIDFERVAFGQPEWDLAVTATEFLTGGWWTAEEYAAFADAYGFDVTGWTGFAVARAVNELKKTTWLMQNVGESPRIAEEFAVRMHTLRGLTPPRPWSPH